MPTTASPSASGAAGPSTNPCAAKPSRTPRPPASPAPLPCSQRQAAGVCQPSGPLLACAGLVCFCSGLALSGFVPKKPLRVGPSLASVCVCVYGGGGREEVASSVCTRSDIVAATADQYCPLCSSSPCSPLPPPRSLSLSLLPSLTLSFFLAGWLADCLSVTHTHTHTQARTR